MDCSHNRDRSYRPGEFSGFCKIFPPYFTLRALTAFKISIQAYTIDAFTLYAASGLAANTVIRSIMAALIPLAAPKLYAVLGLGWGNSLLAFLALAMVPVPVLLFFYGERMRGWNADRLSRL